MSKFKVGDKVRRIKSNHGGMIIGDEAIVKRVDIYGDVVLSGYGRSSHNHSSLELIKEVKQEKVMKQSKSWQFESRSSRDIDFDAIYNELSHKNPIALIDAQHICVVIHDTLLLKAKIVSIPLPESIRCTNAMYPNMFELFNTKPAVIVAWAKQVKDASWPSMFQKKATVTVNLLNI